MRFLGLRVPDSLNRLNHPSPKGSYATVWNHRLETEYMFFVELQEAAFNFTKKAEAHRDGMFKSGLEKGHGYC